MLGWVRTILPSRFQFKFEKRSPNWGPRNLHKECAHPSGWRDKHTHTVNVWGMTLWSCRLGGGLVGDLIKGFDFIALILSSWHSNFNHPTNFAPIDCCERVRFTNISFLPTSSQACYSIHFPSKTNILAHSNSKLNTSSNSHSEHTTHNISLFNLSSFPFLFYIYHSIPFLL